MSDLEDAYKKSAYLSDDEREKTLARLIGRHLPTKFCPMPTDDGKALIGCETPVLCNECGQCQRERGAQ